MLAAHEHATGQQVVVVTLQSLQGYTIEDYGYQLGRYWGIGQKGKNTGAMLIVAPKEHKVRIEVGYGLEGTLTDAQPHDNRERHPAGLQARRLQRRRDGRHQVDLTVLGGNQLRAGTERSPSYPGPILPSLIVFLII